MLAAALGGRCSYRRVITLISCNRCQGRPTTSASNCAWLSAIGAAVSISRGHTKRPALSLLAAHHTPKPSCTSILMRVDHMGKQTLGARAHVHRRRTQPEGVNADHRKTSRSHAAQSAAALTGHVTLTPSAPRLNSSAIISDMAPGGLAGAAGVSDTVVGTVNSMKRGGASAAPIAATLDAFGGATAAAPLMHRVVVQLECQGHCSNRRPGLGARCQDFSLEGCAVTAPLLRIDVHFAVQLT